MVAAGTDLDYNRKPGSSALRELGWEKREQGQERERELTHVNRLPLFVFISHWFFYRWYFLLISFMDDTLLVPTVWAAIAHSLFPVWFPTFLSFPVTFFHVCPEYPRSGRTAHLTENHRFSTCLCFSTIVALGYWIVISAPVLVLYDYTPPLYTPPVQGSGIKEWYCSK